MNQNRSKVDPKSIKNRLKIGPKSIKNRSKTSLGAKPPKDANIDPPKAPENYFLVAKLEPSWGQVEIKIHFEVA